MAMFPLSDDAGREEVVAEINVTPLTDIFLVLLIVFMVTSTTLTQAGLNVSLPRSRTASSQAQGVTITAAADGTVLVDSQPTTLADMGRLLHATFARGRERTVTIRGDERVGLGTVVAIMDVARRAGAEKIGVATRPGDR
jgi:biopolymer transport protein ExbD